MENKEMGSIKKVDGNFGTEKTQQIKILNSLE